MAKTPNPKTLNPRTLNPTQPLVTRELHPIAQGRLHAVCNSRVIREVLLDIGCWGYGSPNGKIPKHLGSKLESAKLTGLLSLKEGCKACRLCLRFLRPSRVSTLCTLYHTAILRGAWARVGLGVQFGDSFRDCLDDEAV